jgi:hypothetical protein
VHPTTWLSTSKTLDGPLIDAQSAALATNQQIQTILANTVHIIVEDEDNKNQLLNLFQPIDNWISSRRCYQIVYVEGR